MSNFVLQNQKILLGPYHLTSRANAVALSQAQAALDDTTFGQNTVSNLPGLKSVTFSVSGLYDPDPSYDGGLSSQLGLTNRPFTVSDSTTAGSLAYFLNAGVAEYTPFQNKVGELAGFSAGGVATKGTSANPDLIRGQVAYWAGTLTTSTNGTAINLGAATSSQKVAAAVHILTLPSTTYSLLPTIESAASSAASSSQWTTRFTFSTFAAPGSTFLSSTGNITDTWWRLSHVTATSSQESTGIELVGVFGIY